MSWREFIACKNADPELFFDGREASAKRICQRCPVRLNCLADAIEFESAIGITPFGIWGGMNAGERLGYIARMKKVING